MVERAPKILAREKKATTTSTLKGDNGATVLMTVLSTMTTTKRPESEENEGGR